MNIVSLLFIMTLLSVFATGILMLLVMTKRNRLQLTLAGILGVLLVMMVVAMINMAQSPDHIHNILSSPLRFRFLALGLVAFFATMAYYMVAAHRNMLTLRSSILFLSPVLLTLIVYVSWHWGAGVPMDYAYVSLREVWENRFSVPVILRVLMFLFFLVYQGVMFRNMWHLDAMRSKHSILNSPDAVSNIRWLRMVVLGMMTVLVVYSFLVFIPSLLVLVIYSVVLASVFIYFIYNALAHPMYEDTEGWQAIWTPRDGWKIIEGNTECKPVEMVVEPIVVESAEPLFPLTTEESDNVTLSKLLQKNDDHPQTYIRHHRIKEACRIILSEKEVKVSELALRVGFSHTSSFSRAFSTVMGETVLQYMNRAGVKRKPKSKSKNNNVNNI